MGFHYSSRTVRNSVVTFEDAGIGMQQSFQIGDLNLGKMIAEY